MTDLNFWTSVCRIRMLVAAGNLAWVRFNPSLTLTSYYNNTFFNTTTPLSLCGRPVFLLVEVGSVARTFSWKNSHQQSLYAVGNELHRKLPGPGETRGSRCQLYGWLAPGWNASVTNPLVASGITLWQVCLFVSYVMMIKSVLDPLSICLSGISLLSHSEKLWGRQREVHHRRTVVVPLFIHRMVPVVKLQLLLSAQTLQSLVIIFLSMYTHQCIQFWDYCTNGCESAVLGTRTQTDSLTCELTVRSTCSMKSSPIKSSQWQRKMWESACVAFYPLDMGE